MKLKRFLEKLSILFLGNTSDSVEKLKSSIDELDMKVYRDALVLDKVISKNAPDSEGKVVFGNVEVKQGDEKAKNIRIFSHHSV